MIKMPKWFPIAIIIGAIFGLGNMMSSEIDRNDMLFMVGMITWAILSRKDDEVKE